MSARIKLKRFLLDHPAFAIEPGSISTMRWRARRQKKPDPFPFLVEENGVNGLLVDVDSYNFWAARKGRPQFVKEGGAR